MGFQTGETRQELETQCLVITFVVRLMGSHAQGLFVTPPPTSELALASQKEERGPKGEKPEAGTDGRSRY